MVEGADTLADTLLARRVSYTHDLGTSEGDPTTEKAHKRTWKGCMSGGSYAEFPIQVLRSFLSYFCFKLLLLTLLT